MERTFSQASTYSFRDFLSEFMMIWRFFPCLLASSPCLLHPLQTAKGPPFHCPVNFTLNRYVWGSGFEIVHLPSISLNHHKALINPEDKPASLEWQRSVFCVRGRTWFSSCSKCFFQYLSVCVCLGDGGLLLLSHQEEDTSKYAQIIRKAQGFTP